MNELTKALNNIKKKTIHPALIQLLVYLFENEVQHQRIVEAVFRIKNL